MLFADSVPLPGETILVISEDMSLSYAFTVEKFDDTGLWIEIVMPPANAKVTWDWWDSLHASLDG